MVVLGASKGIFKTVPLDTSEGQGVQVTFPGGGSPVGSSSLVSTFSVAQAENYAVAQCLNGGVFLHTFGHDPQRSQFSLGVTTFLRPCNGALGADFANALSAYRMSRVSASHDQAQLSVGTGMLRGYLIGQSVDTIDPGIGIISTTYTFIALSAQ